MVTCQESYQFKPLTTCCTNCVRNWGGGWGGANDPCFHQQGYIPSLTVEAGNCPASGHQYDNYLQMTFCY